MRTFLIWDSADQVRLETNLDLDNAQEKAATLNKKSRKPRFFIYPEGTALPITDFRPEPSCQSSLEAKSLYSGTGMKAKRV